MHYTDPDTRRDAAHLYKWVRKVISHAPLETLRLVVEDIPYGPAPTFDSLLEHLSARHAKTMRVLDMRDCFVGSRTLRRFCGSCPKLEELAVAVSLETLVRAFQSLAIA